MRNRIRVRRKDRFRSLVTEALPAETPIIFSNDGFYLRCVKNEATSGSSELVFNKLVRGGAESDRKQWFVPYSYRIKRSALKYRTLSVLHPGAQWGMMEFYDNFSPLILNYTRRSPFSIRSPKDYAKSYYKKAFGHGSERFKKGGVAEYGVDMFLSHSPSYFSYSGHSRLYKFFDSVDFIELEATFSELWMIDVAKCFDSIYTHSISWAVKEKTYAKSNVRAAYFGDSFDLLMQSMNYGETSGIVIGPECSRIFAEIILQAVDNRAARRLKSEHGLVADKHYAVRRYVDDFFVFARGATEAETIYAVICDELAYYKLGVNEAKIKKYDRPFLTEKSKTIIEVSQAINQFTRTISSEPKDPELRYLLPREIYRPDRLALSFCNDVKLCCAANRCEYDEVSGYVISSLKNRAIRLMDSFEKKESASPKYYADALGVILRVLLFLYGVAPSVTASYRLCAAVLLITRFLDQSIPEHAASIKDLIFSRAKEILERCSSRASVDGFIDLESQNLLLSISELGADYRLEPQVIFGMFCREPARCSYFNLVTLLFYIKDEPRYADSRRWAMEVAESRLTDLNEIGARSEQALLFLDLLSCPYIEKSRKSSWIANYLKSIDVAQSEATAVLADSEAHHWFVNWHEIDLLNLLERKELQVVY